MSPNPLNTYSEHRYNSENRNNSENRVYAERYKKGLTEYLRQAWEYKRKPNPRAWQKHKRPSVWGFHDYADVIHDRTTNASEFEYFASGGKLGKPRIWISEAGVLLHTGGRPGEATGLVVSNDEKAEYEQQSKAAKWFLNLRYAIPEHEPFPRHEGFTRIERVYYYEYEAPAESVVDTPGKENEFDSGLVEATPGSKGISHGEPRPAYCYLAYETHDCPPTVVTLPQPSNGGGPLRATIDTHGLTTTVEMNFSGGGCGGGTFCSEPFDETLTLPEPVGSGVLKPFPVSFPKKGCPGSYSYFAKAHNSGGSTTGKTLAGEIGCF